MEYTLESDGKGGWIVSQGRGSVEQTFAQVNLVGVSALCESGSSYVHFANVALVDNGDGTATISAA